MRRSATTGETIKLEMDGSITIRSISLWFATLTYCLFVEPIVSQLANIQPSIYFTMYRILSKGECYITYK